jgi:hypothetical protein
MGNANRTAVIVFRISLILGLLCLPGARVSGNETAHPSASLSGGQFATPLEDPTQAMERTADPGYAVAAQTGGLPVAHWPEERPYLEKKDRIPDYLQTDPAYGGLPDQGRMYCGPVAVANSIMWLDENGYDRLVLDTEDRKKDQFELISVLGSPAYMNTGPERGTSIGGFLNGVHKYVLERGYPRARLAYQGWRDHGTTFGTGIAVPDLAWIRAGVRGSGSAWLNIGWYTYDPESDEYTRHDGHWVTLVGYGYDDRLDHPAYLVMHDPAWGNGTDIRHHYLLLDQITGGMLVGAYHGLPHDATGYYRVTRRTTLETAGGRETTLKPGVTIGILDGVAMLEMENP